MPLSNIQDIYQHYHRSKLRRVEDQLNEQVMIFALIGVYMLISVIKITIEQKKSRAEEELEYLWDIRKQLRHVFNMRINVIFWILAVVQSMLIFYGYSLLTLGAS